jgi:DNA polymerase-1
VIDYPYRVADENVLIRVPETEGDLREFFRWLAEADARGPVAVDTETTGLDIFSGRFRLRTAQFGDRRTAWVIHWERGGIFREAALWALRRLRRILIHNAPYDWLVLDRHAGIRLEDLAPRTVDTRLLAGLVDPRQPQDGGRGTALKPLSAFYVDPTAPDTQGDLTAVFRSLKLTKATGWAGIPLDHPTYNLYAGLDCIYTARLEPELRSELDAVGVRPMLLEYEHALAQMCAVMSRTGMVLDIPYTEGLAQSLSEEQYTFASRAARYGVENVNATRQIVEALQAMGETLTERTPSGALKVDKAVLLELADLDRDWERVGLRTPNPLAEAIIRSKRAGKWRTSYADNFLTMVSPEGRIHPSINSMQARTARMSITNPAVQTLPSGDWMIRRALLAEEGHVFISCDFQAIEMRVLAALAGVKRMADGFRNGNPDGSEFDIHMFTAQLIKGPGATYKDRKVLKGAGLGKIYGGGVPTLARQTGEPEEDIRRAVNEYDRVYPEIRRKSAQWQREAYQTGMVHLSVTGRRLPLDRHRTYAVVNYACQSAARDVLGQSLLNMQDAGLLEYLRLPIHDEVLASVPKEDAPEIAREIERCMTWDLMDVPIVAKADIGGRSWGSLYGAAA